MIRLVAPAIVAGVVDGSHAADGRDSGEFARGAGTAGIVEIVLG